MRAQSRQKQRGRMDMDIAGLSMDMAMMNVQSKVSVAMLDKSLDTERTLGDGLVQMMDAAAMERSVNPAVGGSIDIRL